MKNKLFAERLRTAIDGDDNISESGLALKAGLSDATIRKLLAGNTRNPRMDTAQKICKALGTTLEEFMSNAQTSEEKEIVRLTMQLPAHLRRELLGYGRGLAAQVDRDNPESPEDEESIHDQKQGEVTQS